MGPSVAAHPDKQSGVQSRASWKLTDIYVDADACPVREEIYRVAARLQLNVFIVSNGSRPIRPPSVSNVRMVLVGDAADAADDWIAEHISAAKHVASLCGSMTPRKNATIVLLFFS